MSATAMLGAIDVAKTAPLSAGSIFKDPSSFARSRMGVVQGNIDAIIAEVQVQDPGFLTPTFSTDVNSYSSSVVTNLDTRLKTLPAEIGLGNAYNSMKNTLAKIDNPAHSPTCDFIKELFGSISDIGSIVGEATAAIVDTFASVAGVIGDIASEAFMVVSGAIASVLAAVKSAIGAATAAIGAAITSFTNLVADELAKLGQIIDELLDFSFLNNIFDFDLCGVMSSVVDETKVDPAVGAGL